MKAGSLGTRWIAGAVLAAATVASPALAQTAAPGGGGGAVGPLALVAQFAPFLLVFVIMYFLLIRPQQQRQQELTKLQGALKKGDRVVTTSGIFDTIVGVDEDKAVLRVDENVKIEFQRSTIVGLVAEKK